MSDQIEVREPADSLSSASVTPLLASVSINDLHEFIRARIRESETRLLAALESDVLRPIEGLWQRCEAMQARIGGLESPNVPAPPGQRAHDSDEVERLVRINLANARAMVDRVERMLRGQATSADGGNMEEESARKALLADIEALKGRC